MTAIANMLAGAAPVALCLGWIAVRQARLIANIARRTDLIVPATPNAGDGSAKRIARNLATAAALIDGNAHRLAQRHATTGLPTREPLFARIEEDLSVGGGVLGLLAFVDQERVAAFDATLADRVLNTMATRVVAMIGRRAMVAQVDRSRLALWYGPDTPADTARAAIGALRYALGAEIREDDATLLPDVRVGIATAPRDGATPQALLARAVAALVTGGEGGNVVTADPVARARGEYALEQGLRHAVARDEFALAFQPLVDAEAGAIVGAEALLRWTHPDLGIVSPARFMPIAESAGLADEIGLWVLNAACRQARAWQTDGLDALRIAVNVSGHQLHRADMRQLVERTLARHGLRADRLEIELTETVAADDVERAAGLFAQLRALGVAVAIDDFGTGFSSLSALRRLGFDKLKIDREFVTAVHQRRESQAICQSLIALARGLGIRLLAEGVETEDEYRWLRAQGCRYFQGYYFSKPLDAGAFAALARDADRLARLTGGAATPERRIA